ncbi:hypothetical protein TNCV_2753711 [Trichonephila clavipes]|nr:hypothetical protein TNCV_2753711 [Trichonephila clavipes]
MRKDGMRNEGMRNEGHETPGCIEDPILEPRIEACFQTQSVSETLLCTAINAHFPRKCPSLFPQPSLRFRANPNLFRRSFEPCDQMLYHRMVLDPTRCTRSRLEPVTSC